MKIAILLSGYPRGYKAAYSFNKLFYNMLENEGIELNFYIHTYSYNLGYDYCNNIVDLPDRYKYSTDYISNVNYSKLHNELEDVFKPNSLKISSYEDMHSWCKTKVHLLGEFENNSFNFNYVLGKHYSMKTNFHQVCKNLDDYDLIFMSKMDQVFQCENRDKFLGLLSSLEKNTVYTPNMKFRNPYIKILDKFLIFTPETIEKCFSNYDWKISKLLTKEHMPQKKAKNLFEFTNFYWFKFSEVNVNFLPYIKTRILRKDLEKKIDTINFDQIEEFDKLYESNRDKHIILDHKD